MNSYKYQRSRSFIDLCPGNLRFRMLIFFSKTAGLIETKLHVEPLLDGGNESLCMGSGIKMSAMPIYGENL